MAEAVVQDVAWSEGERATGRGETEYRTFPRRIAPALVGGGAALAFIGALGSWIRAAEITSSANTTPHTVGVAWGYGDSTGRAIAIYAGVVVFIALMSYFTAYLPRFAREGASLMLFGILVARLITLNSRTVATTNAARANPVFKTFTASFGWGAWLMLLAAVLVFLGFLVGLLREIDLRRGKPE
jgi:hypothetical protein